MHSSIMCTPNFGVWNSGKKFLYIIQTDDLEFIVAKYNINLECVQVFYQFLLTKNKNLLALDYDIKIYWVFRANK